MSRLLILLIFAVWLLIPGRTARPVWGPWAAAGILCAGYVILVAAVAYWARRLAREMDASKVGIGQRRFNRIITFARSAVPAWLALGIFSPLGWGSAVLDWLAPISHIDVRHRPAGDAVFLILPGLIVGTLPAILAWIGLWWAQFPADRTLREQTILDQLDADAPLHAPPRLRQYLSANFRQQILFMGLPIIFVLVVRDLALIGFRVANLSIGHIADFDNWIILPALVVVFLFAPDILRRVLKTSRLPDGPLRFRLEEICRRMRLRYREILLWDTQYSMGNAAVMGIIPQMRYIMLSDLLLESLSDEQIEAVFAHEMGHIKHHHMAWYVAFFALMALAAIGPGKFIDSWLSNLIRSTGSWGESVIRGDLQPVWEAVVGIALLAITFSIFGFLSRRFERQADVFAARMMQSNWGLGRPTAPSLLDLMPIPDPPTIEPVEASDHVGEYGARLFASALHRVAIINNMPISARSWCHGSIAKRMDYLHDLSEHPSRTSAFDSSMFRLYMAMVLAILACGAIALVPLSM